jgi:hypothetical protein
MFCTSNKYSCSEIVSCLLYLCMFYLGGNVLYKYPCSEMLSCLLYLYIFYLGGKVLYKYSCNEMLSCLLYLYIFYLGGNVLYKFSCSEIVTCLLYLYIFYLGVIFCTSTHAVKFLLVYCSCFIKISLYGSFSVFSLLWKVWVFNCFYFLLLNKINILYKYTIQVKNSLHGYLYKTLHLDKNIYKYKRQDTISLHEYLYKTLPPR